MFSKFTTDLINLKTSFETVKYISMVENELKDFELSQFVGMDNQWRIAQEGEYIFIPNINFNCSPGNVDFINEEDLYDLSFKSNTNIAMNYFNSHNEYDFICSYCDNDFFEKFN